MGFDSKLTHSGLRPSSKKMAKRGYEKATTRPKLHLEVEGRKAGTHRPTTQLPHTRKGGPSKEETLQQKNQ